MKRFIKDGIILPLNSITVENPDGSFSYNITEETANKHGWEEYVDPMLKKARDYTSKILNTSTSIEDDTALEMEEYFKEWNTYIGESLSLGQIVKYNGVLYRVIQDIPQVLEIHFPSLDTASLYNAINLSNEGTETDTIEYVPPMEIFEGKYYTQNGNTYRCMRNSEQALAHNLSELVGLYVELI